MPPVCARRLGGVCRQLLSAITHHRHDYSHSITPAAVVTLRARQWRGYSSPSSSSRKLNIPIEFNASTLLAHSSTTALANPELSGDVGAGGKTKKMNYFQAVNDALATILEADEKACIFGEDVAFGGTTYRSINPPISLFFLFFLSLV